jgi:urease accessory protein
MFCERVVGQIDPDAPPAGLGVDWLDLSWFDCTQRALRKRTRGGADVRVLLPVGQTPRHGDVLHRDDGVAVAVNLLPTAVLVVRPQSIADMGRLAVELGNLHVPVEVAGPELVVIPDGPTEALLRKACVPFGRDLRRFVPERASVAGMPVRAGDFTVSRAPAAPVTEA